MSSVICTLFEGHYHYGVAVLVNSLYNNGYRGTIYAGYKGALPKWANNLKTVPFLNGSASLMQVADGLQIIFVPLTTDYHLTNYKPDFMIEVWTHHSEPASGIFYFDPDIVLVQEWKHLEDWIACGVAVAEDVNSPLQKFHPRRCAWRKYFDSHGLHLQFKNPIYVNGGFLGVSIDNIDFLHLWKKIQETMALKIGGLNRSSFIKSDQLPANVSGDFAPFGKTDQDALNACIEAYPKLISYGGKEVMGFKNGLLIIPHALGHTKPWMISPFIEMLKGKKPRMVDKAFWNNSNSPISAYTQWNIKRKLVGIKFSSFLCRFYSK